jgi:hypothetical protein
MWGCAPSSTCIRTGPAEPVLMGEMATTKTDDYCMVMDEVQVCNSAALSQSSLDKTRTSSQWVHLY